MQELEYAWAINLLQYETEIVMGQQLEPNWVLATAPG